MRRPLVPPRIVLFAIFVAATLLNCRLGDTLNEVQQRRLPPTAVAAAKPKRTLTPTPTETVEPTETEEPTATLEPSPEPTDTPAPTATTLPTRTPAPPTRKPPPTQTFTPAPPPSPTRCPYRYCVVVPKPCQPEAGNTIIEGTVYAGGAPENDVYVRVALEEGGFPLVDDFASGTDPINPGKPDPARPGRYILQIVPGAAREGNWWVFVVDSANPSSANQISEAKFIHTNDAAAPGNCQHAFVDFVR